jgi:membrane fusion protein (multidrug efflux system)
MSASKRAASKWAMAILGCAAVLAGLGFYKVAEIRAGIAQAEAYPEQSETVEVATVAAGEYRRELNVVGEVVAPQRLDLRNEIAGEIAAVNFASGAPISKGQVLIQLDDSVERANLQAAQARADLARLVLDRNTKLFDSGVSNADQMDRARAELTTASAQIDVLNRTIEKMTLRAPFDGRAGLHTFEVGQFLQSNTLITNLVGDTDDMWVDFQVPQFYRQLPSGTELSVTTIDDENDSTRTPAVVIAEGTILNPSNRSRGYRARIPNRSAQYSANTMVNVHVPTGEVERVLSVPAVAVQNDPLGQFVYALGDDGNGRGLRAKRQRVDVKVVENDRALLEPGTGLAEGDQIAGAGAFKLYEGILVVAGERTPAAPSEGRNPDAPAHGASP